MFALVLSLVSVLVQARSFVIPIAPTYLPKRFSVDEPAESYDSSLSNSASIGSAICPGIGTVVGGIFGSGHSPSKVGSGIGSAICPGVGTVVGGIFGSGRRGVDDGSSCAYDAEDVDDKIKLGHVLKHLVPYVLAHDQDDELDDGKINWGEITKIAGQVNQIGQILGFDAEDSENFVDLDPRVTRIWNNYLTSVKEKAKKQKYEQMVEDNLMQLKAQQEAEKKFAKMNKGKHFGAEDLEDWSASFSGSVSSNNDLENKFKIKKIFSGARKIAKIGAALGYGAEDLNDLSLSIAKPLPIGAAIMPRFRNYY